MFDALAERLTAVFSRLRGKGTLTEADVAEGLREIRMALLEADVHYKVVKELVARIHDRAVGEDVLQSLTPGQQVVKIVRDELAETMGGERTALRLDRRPAVVLLVGLQGSGKTTTAAKLANALRKDGRKPVLVAADVYRPAAIDQLEKLGRDLDIPVVSRTSSDPVKIAAAGVAWTKENLRDVVLIDTAGRLQIDDEMMKEIADIAAAVTPDETLLVADAMTGQEAVAVATAFHERVGLTAVILTKMDGDARGGAALSIRHATGRPIVYVGTGEKIDGLEPFHPKRMADRILGMGDVLTLIEQAEAQMDTTKAERLVEQIRKNRFTLQDFLEQLEEVRKLGPLSQILDRLPGAAKLMKGRPADADETEIQKTLAILRSMTLEERTNPSIIGGSRKKRIARGSGTKVRDVNSVLTRYEEAKRALKWAGTRRGKERFPADLLGSS
ncbi:MAG: signal recognition particle protein [Candidatus Bipolaricaulis sp.]|nr:signal recognition particle protein [Candidatus Bipolaricaulis sp.]